MGSADPMFEAGGHDGTGASVWLQWVGRRPSQVRRKLLLRALVLVSRLLGVRMWIGEFRTWGGTRG